MKIPNVDHATIVAAASFEQRSSVWVGNYLAAGGRIDAVFLADVVEYVPTYEAQLSAFEEL